MAFSKGVKSEVNSKIGVYVSEIHDGDYIKLQAVDFGDVAPARFMASAACALRGGTIEIHADSIGGVKMAELKVPGTGGWEEWQTLTASIQQGVTGVHDLYFVFKGRKGVKLMNLDWWTFKK